VTGPACLFKKKPCMRLRDLASVYDRRQMAEHEDWNFTMIKFSFLFTLFLGILVCSPVCPHAQTVSSSSGKLTSPQQAEAVAAREKRRVSPSSAPPDSAANSKAEAQRRTAEAKRYYKLGVTYGQAKHFKDAAAAFLQATRLKPDYADAYYGLGHAYCDMERWEDSIKAFEKVISLDPKDEEAYARLGELHTRLRAAENATLQPRDSSPIGEKMALVATFTSPSTGATPKPAEPNNAGLTGIYKVGIGDVLDVQLRDAPSDRSTLFTITANGFLEYPVLDRPLKAVGLTPEEISEKLKTELQRLAVRQNPEVLVGVREYNSHAILISGLVKEPGTKILRREGIPLYVVLADAQTLADAAWVTIISHVTGTSEVELSDPTSTNLLVRPGDVITVRAAPQQFVYVGGDVKSPGEKPFRPGLMLTQAILSAGGVTTSGKKIELARSSANGLLAVTKYKLEEINSGKLPDPPVQAGDRITVVH
jgi:protein involved in polysaccharide export with SLBB domain